MFLFECKRMIRSKYLVISILLIYACLLLEIWPDFVHAQYVDVLYLSNTSWEIGAALLMLPAIAMAGYGVSYFEDTVSGFCNMVETRKYWGSYAAVKLLVGFLSGILSVFGGVLLLFVTAFVMRGNDVVISAAADVFYYGAFLSGFLENGNWPLVFFLKTLGYGCFAGLCCALGIAISPFIKNKYVVFSAPFFICRLASMLTAYTGMILLNPYHIPLRQGVQKLPFSGIPYEICYVTMLMCGFYMLFCYGIKRGRRHG